MGYRMSTIAMEYRNLPEDMQILEPGRSLVFEDKLKVVSKGKLISVQAVLFSDMLMWSTSGAEAGETIRLYRGHMKMRVKTGKGNKEYRAVVKPALEEQDYQALNIFVPKHMKKRGLDKDLPKLGLQIKAPIVNPKHPVVIEHFFAHNDEGTIAWTTKLKDWIGGK